MTSKYPCSMCSNYLVTYYIIYEFNHTFFGDCLDISHNSDKNEQMFGLVRSNVTNHRKTMATHYLPDNRKSFALQY